MLKASCLFSRRTSLTARATATAVCPQEFREADTTPSTKPLSTGLVFSLSHACVFGETWVGRSCLLIFHHFVWAPRLDFGSRGPNSTQLNVFLHSIGYENLTVKIIWPQIVILRTCLVFHSPDVRCQDTPALLSQETPLLPWPPAVRWPHICPLVKTSSHPSSMTSSPTLTLCSPLQVTLRTASKPTPPPPPPPLLSLVCVYNSLNAYHMENMFFFFSSSTPEEMNKTSGRYFKLAWNRNERFLLALLWTVYVHILFQRKQNVNLQNILSKYNNLLNNFNYVI